MCRRRSCKCEVYKYNFASFGFFLGLFTFCVSVCDYMFSFFHFGWCVCYCPFRVFLCISFLYVQILQFVYAAGT